LRSETVLLIVGPDIESLSLSLRGILQPHFKVEVLALEGFVEARLSINPTSVLDKLGNKSAPALIFVLLSANCVPTAGTLIQSIKAAGSNPPIMIILEAGEPTDILNLLDLGVADFITSPLTASEVLPRAWTLMRRLNSETMPQPAGRTEVKHLTYGSEEHPNSWQPSCVTRWYSGSERSTSVMRAEPSSAPRAS